MKKYNVQICLVSDKIVPNVSPILDDDIRPEKVILCTSGKFIEQTEFIANFLSEKGISVKIIELNSAHNFKKLKENFFSLASSFEDCHDVAVNLTGGNRIMGIAAQLVFGENGFDCFYVDSATDQIIMINDAERDLFEIQDKLKIEEFFQIHGYKVTNGPKRNLLVPSESRQLFSEILSDTSRYVHSLGTLNYIASQAERNQSLIVNQHIPEDSYELLQLFQKHGSISYFDDKRVEFNTRRGRNFCHGFWLEDYIYLEMKKIDNAIGLQDFACSVEISSDHGVPNELDGVFIYNNHMYIIECKTSKMEGKGSNIVYKSDTIKNYAGVNTTGIIASFKHLNEHDKQRAEDLGILVVSGDELLNFGEIVLQLLKPEITPTHR